jgi:hypothetical protein
MRARCRIHPVNVTGTATMLVIEGALHYGCSKINNMHTSANILFLTKMRHIFAGVLIDNRYSEPYLLSSDRLQFNRVLSIGRKLIFPNIAQVCSCVATLVSPLLLSCPVAHSCLESFDCKELSCRHKTGAQREACRVSVLWQYLKNKFQ